MVSDGLLAVRWGEKKGGRGCVPGHQAAYVISEN